MKNKIIIWVSIFSVFILAGAILFLGYTLLPQEEGVGGASFATPENIKITDSNYHLTFNAFEGTSTPATSTAIDISGAKKVTALFKNDPGGAGGVATFGIWVSHNATTTPDYNNASTTDYTQFQQLIPNWTNTNGQELTRVGPVSINATGTFVYSMDLQYHAFNLMKCTVYETTNGGSYGCKLIIEK